MTDEREPKVTAAYRELGTEEPPRALDEAILAAARRAAGARPGSPGRAAPQRWYASLAAAAVLVLAVAVTLHMQTEQPDTVAPPSRVEATARPAAPAPAKSAADTVAKAAPDRVEPKVQALAKPAEPRPFVPDPVPRAAPAPAPTMQAQARMQGSGLAASATGPAAGAAAERDVRAQAPASAIAESPERELERIAALRGQGRHDEADSALAEFRKRYPEFRIPEEMRARLERR
jgi:hypothetical protein